MSNLIPLFIVLLAIGLMWWASQNSPVQCGTVIDKRMTPEHRIDSSIIVTNWVGAMWPVTIPERWVPDQYELQLQDEYGRTGWVNVTAEIYDQTQIDDYFDSH